MRDRPQSAEPLDPAAAISIRGLSKRYGEFVAVDGLDLDIRRGEIFALLGTNGAGKTSTVELLEGLALPSAGQIRVLGFDPYSERKAVRPRTGVMLQEGGFPSELTVTETVRMWAGCTSDARPVAELRPLPEAPRSPRPIGLGQGLGTIHPEFYDPLPDDLLDAFEGQGG